MMNRADSRQMLGIAVIGGMGGNGAKGGVMLALDTLAGADTSDVEAASAAVISAIALSLCKRFCASISARVGAALLGAGG